jgi:hypothetical protein
MRTIESNFAGHKLQDLNKMLRDLKQIVRRTHQPDDEKYLQPDNGEALSTSGDDQTSVV